MNIKNFFQRIQNTLNPQEELQDEVVLKFLKILEDVREEEMSCSEMYDKLDEFVEREVETHDAEKIMPLIQEHLDMCPECCDEYEALLDVLEHTEEDPKGE
jgi:DNA replication protein DnaD